MPEQVLDDGKELIGSDWLGDVVVHAGGETMFLVPFHSVCGHSDDRNVGAGLSFSRTNPRGGLESIHLGHLDP